MLKKTLAAALVAGLASTAVQAANWDGTAYIQGSVGQAKAEKPSFVKQEARSLGATNSKADRKDTAFKLIAGLKLTKYIALEGQYIDLGKAQYKLHRNDIGYQNKIKTSTKGFGTNLVGTVPLNDFSIFAKVGLHSLKTNFSDKDSQGYSATGSRTRWAGSYGVGASYEFINNLAAVVEYERYHKVANTKVWAGATRGKVSVKHDIDMLSAGLNYSF